MNGFFVRNPIVSWVILIVFILLMGLVLVLAIGKYENSKLVTTKYVITSEYLPKGFDGHRFCVLADLHNNSFGKNNEILLREIKKQSPDAILVAGDLIIGNEVCNYDVAITLLEQLAKKYEIFYSYGNHEQKVVKYELQMPKLQAAQLKSEGKCTSLQQYEDYIKKLGVHVLKNERFKYQLESGAYIQIIGGVIDLEFFKRRHRPSMAKEYMNDLLGKSDESKFQLLIAHNPMYFGEYANWGADVVVSGHVHGGMVRLPLVGGVISPQMKLFPKYDAGVYTKTVGNRVSNMIVSRGLGIHTIKIRVFNRPELVCFELRKK